jgi:hypothetical protein
MVDISLRYKEPMTLMGAISETSLIHRDYLP